jgi:NitT/TauT family transport system substrate-binding protein/putative hydroxymethylpyrimidine transport system substrate-binding protein
MRSVVALLAAVLCALLPVGCGDGAEPGAPVGATLVLDFQPNAVHAGIYLARSEEFLATYGVDLEIREPSSTADGAKLLEAGRADFAVLDINDFGIARERGLDVRAIAGVVQRPLAAVIAADRDEVRTPRDLKGATVGVTGVPSDDAVLATVLGSAGLGPDDVDPQTIGFQSVQLLAASRVAAATAFWNAEGVQLREQGVPTREFRVDEFGAPRYPELVIATSGETLESDERLACGLTTGLNRAYSLLTGEPQIALSGLAGSVDGLDMGSQRAQLRALLDASAFSARRGENPTAVLSASEMHRWLAWAGRHGIVPQGSETAERIADGFETDLSLRCR